MLESQCDFNDYIKKSWHNCSDCNTKRSDRCKHCVRQIVVVDNYSEIEVERNTELVKCDYCGKEFNRQRDIKILPQYQHHYEFFCNDECVIKYYTRRLP